MIENRINQIMTLANGEKYMILKQAIYKDENYYMASLLDKNDGLTDHFKALHEYKKDGQYYVELVTDPDILKLVLTHLIDADKKD